MVKDSHKCLIWKNKTEQGMYGIEVMREGVKCYRDNRLQRSEVFSELPLRKWLSGKSIDYYV